MTDHAKIVYRTGLPEQFRSKAVSLYEEAFGKKISVAVRSNKKRSKLLSNCLMPEYAIVAISKGKLIGIAGFQTYSGSLTGGITYKKLLSQLGFIKGNWAALVFSLYQRNPSPGELVMDGIVVDSNMRRRGIGGKLLDEIAKYANAHKFNRIRLDVINTNPRAKKLYKHKGFKTVKEELYPYLNWLLGFSGSTTMELRLK